MRRGAWRIAAAEGSRVKPSRRVFAPTPPGDPTCPSTPTPAALDAEVIVAAIWAEWDRSLRDWDLEGSYAMREARALAVVAVREVLDAT